MYTRSYFVNLLDHLSQSVNHDYRTTQRAWYKGLAELSEVITPTYGLHGTIIENGQNFISILLNLFLLYICEVSKASQSMFLLENLDEVSIIGFVRHYISELESYCLTS